MTVPYEAAVETIQSVFDGKIDREVVCAVLDANNGHMERTIECLFGMVNEDSSSEPALENLSLDDETSRQSAQQIRDDELYARMLQDQFFVAEMRHNPDFRDVFSEPRHAPLRQSASGSSRPPPTAVSAQPEPDLADKLAQLGSAAKLKLKELYTKFQPKKSPVKDSKSGPYLSVNTEDDDAEVVAFDSSLARRTSTFEVDDGSDEDVPLTNTKKKSSVFGSPSGFQRLTSSSDHKKDD
eukprot:TRINITY_DN4749_c0_g1_i1.p1 TRINITY_DN4749_c0_g1~~TRINITY_DN4749_c0_g1_i1.p1  ORF type:complete len:239 (-),score=52.50 TRINITY_DN4749_c0_g1_i1:396-1112(-)